MLKLYPECSRTSLYHRHAVKSINSTQVVEKCKFKGRRTKVSLREEIIILREMCKLGKGISYLLGSFAIKRL